AETASQRQIGRRFTRSERRTTEGKRCGPKSGDSTTISLHPRTQRLQPKERAMEKTMTEKDQFIQTLQRETEITLRQLKADPADKGDFRPHERSKTAKELAWTFVIEQGLADMALKGRIDLSGTMPPPPPKITDVIAAFEGAVKETAAKAGQASDSDLQRMV